MFGLFALAGVMLAQPAPPIQEIVITRDTILKKNALLNARLVIRASHVTIDGNGATLVGPGKPGQLKTFLGNAITANGCSHITLRNLKARGWKTGLAATDGDGWLIEKCNFSDNYHDPDYDWGNGERVGGLILTRISRSVIRNNKANRVWNGLDLDNCHDNQIANNDFSRCSNVCLKMLTACRNTVSDNNLSYGIRIKPGEVHARDSTSVLIESGSNDNRFFRNDVRYGGDGIFIRVLNNYVSTGNLFVENDCSYANNNGFEAWSPGNTYIRNISNHCSYGFWLGASDQTVLIGNEAGFNGLKTGKHNAPEPDFQHGGIVFVNGPSSHTLVMGNYCHDNGGGGIVLRGDRGTKGGAWKAFHWIIQNNRLENNRWGIFARFADWVHLANNVSKGNAEPDVLEAVTNLTRVDDPMVTQAPRAILAGPTKAVVGQQVVFDASQSFDPAGRPLSIRWDVGNEIAAGPVATRVFNRPGFYRIGVTVSNGVLADMAYRDIVVSAPVVEEIGTEGQGAQWGFTVEGENGRMHFADDTDSVVGQSSLRLWPNPYPGMAATALYPAKKDAKWNLSGKSNLVFWMKLQNPNPGGFQNVGPEIRLIGPKGEFKFTPANGKNFLRDGGYSESRWTWMRLEVPLAGNENWKRETTGSPDLNEINAVSFTFDSFEADPFTVWLDGLAFQ